MLVLKTISHETIWGGSRLQKYAGNDSKKIGHLYSVYCREDKSNLILNGKYRGKTLRKVFEGIKNQYGMQRYSNFPLTIALVDATNNLSIQVHPNDKSAMALEGEKCGKRESWYFLEAPLNGYIFNGCKFDSKEEITMKITENAMQDITERLSVKKGDYVYVEPGTLHAMTEGCLVYEIEEGSDYTYRFYDFDRTDCSGQKRELHIEKALAAVIPGLKSEIKKYPQNGMIQEETYVTHFIEDTKVYWNKSNTLECVTLLKGKMICDQEIVNEGMTVILFPNEKITGSNIQSAIVANMVLEDN